MKSHFFNYWKNPNENEVLLIAWLSDSLTGHSRLIGFAEHRPAMVLEPAPRRTQHAASMKSFSIHFVRPQLEISQMRTSSLVNLRSTRKVPHVCKPKAIRGAHTGLCAMYVRRQSRMRNVEMRLLHRPSISQHCISLEGLLICHMQTETRLPEECRHSWESKFFNQAGSMVSKDSVSNPFFHPPPSFLGQC